MDSRSKHKSRWLSKLPPWIFTVVVGAGIVWLTLGTPPQPDFELPRWEHLDKVVHAVMFGALFIAIALDWYRRNAAATPRYGSLAMWAFAAWSVLAGATIEIIQPYFNRGCDALDFLADIAGIAVAFVLAPWFLRRVLK